VSWQTPPPQHAPQYAAPPPYPVPQSAGLGPTLSAVARWVGAAIVVCLLLAGAVVVHRTVLSRYFGGAASPEEAVTQAIAAIEGGDLTRVGLMLPPDEVAGLSDIVKQVQRISSELGEGSGVGGQTTANGVQVSVKNLQLKTQYEQNGLTKVSVENADITASFDPAKVSGPLRAYLDKKGVAAKATTITVRGADVTTDGSTHTLRLDGREQPPFVMTVQRDGSWYVSPLFTYFQYASEEEGHGTSPAATSPGFDSPVKAAEGYVSALAKAINARDITEFARATGGVEGRLLQTYSSLINASLNRLSRNKFSVNVDNSQFRALSADGNTARVRPESLHLSATSGGESYAIDWDGRCLKVDDPGNHQRLCLGDKSTMGPLTPLVERLNYLVAVRSDGGWKISATRTVFTMVADALGWIGDAEIPIIKALTRRDPTELTKVAKVAGTVQIGKTATIQVEAIGPFLDGGYAVVDIPNPVGAGFAVSCHAKTMGCRVVTLVTPSGKTQGRYSGGRNGESGDYKAIIVAGTGDVQISVRSSP
jgi:hypothetical protein